MADKEITRLYKTLLEIVEDLQKDHDIMMSKVAGKTSQEFSDDVNYFTDEKYEQIRKRILDCGNECERNLISFLSYFDSVVNVERVNEAALQKHTYKKTIVSPPVII